VLQFDGVSQSPPLALFQVTVESKARDSRESQTGRTARPRFRDSRRAASRLRREDRTDALSSRPAEDDMVSVPVAR
jgi:hypothetical protein